MKQLGEGWNWRDLKVGDQFVTYGRTLFEADLLNFVTLCGFSEELFTNKEYIKSHAPMRGGHPVPGALVYSMAEGLVIPTTLQGSGLAFLSMGFDIKGPTYVNDTIHVEIEVTEIKPTSKDPSRALVRTTNTGEEPEGRDGAGLHAAAHDAGALSMAKVAVEKEGAITIVSIDRFAEARNAVDPETAILLREAFLAFDADESQSVAILTGRGGTFCAGYDLKVAASRDGAVAARSRGTGPDGADASSAVQAGDRRGRGLRRGGRARAGAVVRPARGVGERQVRRVLPALGRAADRRRHGAAAAPDRPQPRPRHDPDRPRGRRPRGLRLGPGQPAGAGRPGARGGQDAWPSSSRKFPADLPALRPPVVLRPVGARCRRPRWSTKAVTAGRRSRRRSRKGAARFAAGKGRGGDFGEI